MRSREECTVDKGPLRPVFNLNEIKKFYVEFTRVKVTVGMNYENYYLISLEFYGIPQYFAASYEL